MKKVLAFLLVPLTFLIFPKVIYAHCPLCVAGAGVGLSLSRWIGLDDSITGLWMAAFLGAMAFWSYLALVKKLNKGPMVWLKPTLYLAIFASTLWSFYKFNLVIRMEKMYGLDKLTFGIVAGGIAFYLVDIINDLIIKIRGKSLFPYQRIVLSLGTKLVLSVSLY
ncbi:MAG: hypothetical protein U1C56_01100, partial [Candidatus Curtissbacteria bacterium]|nr:hypothetical protein [Candidatus Curtissbacteria bacterium]